MHTYLGYIMLIVSVSTEINVLSKCSAQKCLAIICKSENRNAIVNAMFPNCSRESSVLKFVSNLSSDVILV